MNDSHAILFRGRRIDVNNLPPTRTQTQKWLFYEFEPPYKVWQYVNLTLLKDSFNITSTYSRDSDVFKNIYIRKCWYDFEKQKQMIKDLETTDFASKKRGMAAWFVSVCRTQSKREKYVKEMQKHIPVDVYGECGNLKCGSSVQTSAETAECERRLLHNKGSYKFYLAFENSLCTDYVTEKLWKLAEYNVVPIVMGAVDYANMRPKDSYIDVQDFESPKALAKFLKYLDKNSTAYNEY
uniref:Fucosyltransferase n=1 Tax=Capitella teleta TaxID=283909 RepID=X2B8R5_CAPTE